MITAPRRDRVLEAQASRLAQVTQFLNIPGAESSTDGDARDRTIHSLGVLVKRIYDEGDDRELWLAFIGMSGAFPG